MQIHFPYQKLPCLSSYELQQFLECNKFYKGQQILTVHLLSNATWAWQPFFYSKDKIIPSCDNCYLVQKVRLKYNFTVHSVCEVKGFWR